MKILNHCIKLQKITSRATIALAVVTAVYCLGFMTSFFTLFMDGDDGMYNYFKEIQSLNTFIFFWGVAFLVLNLITKLFDLQKAAAGPYGLGLTAIIAILSAVFSTMSISMINKYKEAYSVINFESLKEYTVSTAPFSVAAILFSLTIVFSVALFVVCGISFLQARKQGEINEK